MRQRSDGRSRLSSKDFGRRPSFWDLGLGAIAVGIENQVAGQFSCACLFDARGVFSLVADFRKGGDA